MIDEKNKKKIKWRNASDIKDRIVFLVESLELDWISKSNIHCVRSSNSKSRAHARIWGLSRLWQEVLNIEPNYIIEVLSEKFDNLSKNEKDKVLIHELAHIPKNFSGSLLPHVRKKGKRNFMNRVKDYIKKYEMMK